MGRSSDAIFTKRKGDVKSQLYIGGDDKYIALCRECYLLEDDEL